MATPGVINGTAVKLTIAGQNVAYCTNASLSLNTDTIDTTTKDSSGWAEYMGGMNSWEISGDAYYTNASGTNDRSAAYVLSAMTTKSVVTVGMYNSPYQSGDLYWQGSGIFTSLEVNGGVDDAANFSFSIKGTGALTIANQGTSGTTPPTGSGGETP